MPANCLFNELTVKMLALLLTTVPELDTKLWRRFKDLGCSHTNHINVLSVPPCAIYARLPCSISINENIALDEIGESSGLYSRLHNGTIRGNVVVLLSRKPPKAVGSSTALLRESLRIHLANLLTLTRRV